MLSSKPYFRSIGGTFSVRWTFLLMDRLVSRKLRRMRLFLLEASFLKSQHIVRYFLGIRSGSVYFKWSIGEYLDPAIHVGDMLRRIMTDIELGTHHHRSDFCPQFLFGVFLRTELVDQVPVKPLRMAGPMS